MLLVKRTADHLVSLARRLQALVAPSDDAVRGGAAGLLVGTLLIVLLKFAEPYRGLGSAILLLTGPIVVAIAAAMGAVICVIVYLFNALPRFPRLLLGASIFLLMMRISGGALPERLVPTVYVMTVSIALGAAIFVLRWRRFSLLSRLERALVGLALLFGIGGVAVGARWLFGAGAENKPALDAAKLTESHVAAIDAPDPSAPGPYAVLDLTYGSGKDLRRPEYGSGAKLITGSVDGSAFVHGWTGFEAWARARYWGFDATSMPINAHAWYPAGDGPFPVVLIAHGAHSMHHFSEGGYEYLGRQLASHGFIVASVDENFLNAGPWLDLGLGALSGDNAARGFLLLQHLSAFRKWNATPGTPFYKKVDLERVGLMGHSRGGEAITVAAKLNGMSRAPDNALLKLDFHFGIKALVAIATTDRQCLPGGRPIELDDVSYLALQGSNDGDAETFMGAQQFERIHLHPASDAFKATVFIHRASHGQWNQAWGRTDRSPFPRRNYFNSKPVMPLADQQRIGKAYITAFMEAALLGKKEYLPLFQDHRAGAAWLPDTIYVNRYSSSRTRLLTAYDEDVDPLTTTSAGGHLDAANLTVWREQPVGPPGDLEVLSSRGAYVGWDHDAMQGVPSYTMTLAPDTVAAPGSQLVLALSDGNDNPNPHGLQRRDRSGSTHPSWSAAPRGPIDFTIEIVDAAGATARLPLLHVSLLQAQLESRVWKTGFLPPRAPESAFQTITVPLAAFQAQNPAFDPTRLAAIRFVFDRTPAGVVIVSEIGLLPPG